MPTAGGGSNRRLRPGERAHDHVWQELAREADPESGLPRPNGRVLMGCAKPGCLETKVGVVAWIGIDRGQPLQR